MRPYNVRFGRKDMRNLILDSKKKSAIYGPITFCFIHDEEPLEGTWLWFQMRSR